jgi:hypothetical protein
MPDNLITFYGMKRCSAKWVIGDCRSQESDMPLVAGELERSTEGPYEPVSCRREPKLIN